jgi:hypothetical protein
MAQSILIAGNHTKLNSDIVQEALSLKHRVLATYDPETDGPVIPSGLEDSLSYVEWNRRSPISSRFVILQALNKQIELDHAIITFAPRQEKMMVQDLQSASIEEKLDFDAKGYLFLLKELINYFLKRRKGSITFVIQNTGPDIPPPIEAMLLGGFYHLAESMFECYENEPIVLRGIDTKIAANRQVAEYLLQTIFEDQPKNRNKWLKYNGKTGLFSFGR